MYMYHILAQNLTLPGGEGPISGPLKTNAFMGNQITLGSILSSLLRYILPIAGIGLLIMILIAGFTLLTSAGDTKKMEKGKQTLTNGVIGFFIIFLAYWLTQLLGVVFGIKAITEIFK